MTTSLFPGAGAGSVAVGISNPAALRPAFAYPPCAVSQVTCPAEPAGVIRTGTFLASSKKFEARRRRTGRIVEIVIVDLAQDGAAVRQALEAITFSLCNSQLRFLRKVAGSEKTVHEIERVAVGTYSLIEIYESGLTL